MQSLKFDQKDKIDREIEKNFSDLYDLSESDKRNEIKTGELVITLENNLKKKIDLKLLDIRYDQICAYICEEMKKRNFPISFTERTIQKYSPQEFKRAYTKRFDTTDNGTHIPVSKIMFKQHSKNIKNIIEMDLDSLTSDMKQDLYEVVSELKKKIETNADQKKIALFNRINAIKTIDGIDKSTNNGSNNGSNPNLSSFDFEIPIPEKIPNMLSREIDLWIKDLVNFRNVIESLRLTYREEKEYSKGVRSMRLFLTNSSNEKYIRSIDEWCETLKLVEECTISGAAKLSNVETVTYNRETDSFEKIEGYRHSIGHDQLRKYTKKPDYRRFQEIMHGLPFYRSLMKLHREHITPIRGGKEIIREHPEVMMMIHPDGENNKSQRR